MKIIKKCLALALCAAMLAGVAALAEDAQSGAVASTATVLNDADVLATVNGQPVTWADTQPNYKAIESEYGSYYDLADEANVRMFRAVALYNSIVENLLGQKGTELGLDKLTDEEIAALDASADADWEAALESHISYFHSDLTDESSEEDKAAAREEAIKYYNDAGYTPESMRASYKKYAVYDKVQALITQDATVTDEDVEKAYQELVAADKALYENDISAYIEYNNYVDSMSYYAMMYGTASDMDHAWYKPAGFRAVKHILLKVDDELMNAYTDLSARYEEQLHADETAAEPDAAADAAATDESAEPTAEPTATPEPVTEEQVNAAKAAILESLAGKIDEINQKIADGADFDELIATYAVDADGNPTDGGSLQEPYKTSGYEVAQGSTNYYPEFVQAAFSVDNIGDVSAPYISQVGVHIVKYIGDVPAGPVEMTDEQRVAKRESLLTTKKNELYTAKMDEWLAQATIEYTGLVPSMDEIQAEQAAGEETEVKTEQEAEEEMTEDAEAPKE